MMNSVWLISVLLALAATSARSTPEDDFWGEKWDLLFYPHHGEAPFTPSETSRMLSQMSNFYSGRNDPESEFKLREIEQLFEEIEIVTSTTRDGCPPFTARLYRYHNSSSLRDFVEYYRGAAYERVLLSETRPDRLRGYERTIIQEALSFNRMVEGSEMKIKALEKLNKLSHVSYMPCEEFSSNVGMGETAYLVAEYPVLYNYVDRARCQIAELCLNGPSDIDLTPLEPKKTLEFLNLFLRCASNQTRPTLTTTRNLIEASELDDSKRNHDYRKFVENLAGANRKRVNLSHYANYCLERFDQFCANQLDQFAPF